MKKSRKRILNKGLFWCCAVLLVLYSVLAIGTAYVIMWLVDCAVAGDLEMLWKLIIICAAFVLLVFIFTKLTTQLKNTYLTKEVTALHNNTMKRVTGLSFSQYEKNGMGYYLGLFMNDIPLTKESYYGAMLDLVNQVSLLVLGLASMFFINWLIAIVVIVTSVIPLVFSSIYGRPLNKLQNDYLKTFNGYSSSVKSVLSGFGLIKAFHIEDHIGTTVAEDNTKKEKARKKFLIRQGLAQGYASALGTAAVLIVFCLGTYLALNGMMEVGALVAFVQLMNYVLSPIGGIADSINSISSCKSIFEKIDGIGEDAATNTDTLPFPEDYTIKLEDVSCAYDDKRALDGINLTLEAGKKYVIIGENGSGKSTLLNILGRANTAYEGNVFFGKTNQKDITVDDYYKNLVLLQQDVLILNDTIKNNILLYQDDASLEEAYKTVAEEVGLGNLAGRENATVEGEGELSGGEKQRIAAARALLRRPRILLLDESFSALDPEARSSLESLLLGCAETVVAISHDRSKENLCKYDEVIYLSAGKVVAQGSYERITSFISL